MKLTVGKYFTSQIFCLSPFYVSRRGLNASSKTAVMLERARKLLASVFFFLSLFVCFVSTTTLGYSNGKGG